MITPARLDLEIYHGASYSLPITLKDSTGARLDLTERQVFAAIWNDLGTTEMAVFTVAVLDAAQGEIELRLTRTQTLAIPTSRSVTSTRQSVIGAWDLRIVEPDGQTSNYWLEGSVSINRGLS